jgi:hypothetical protein
MDPIGTGTLRGMIAGILTTQILLTALGFIAALDNPSVIGSSSSLIFSIIGYIIVLIGSTILGSLLGLLIGICMLFFERGTRGWLVASIGASIPFLCSLLFGIPQAVLRDINYGHWNVTASALISICIACGIVGWQVNSDLRKKAPPINFQAVGTEAIVQYILQGQRSWNSNRYDIDRELLEKGYDPAEIEKAWAIIAEGRVWLDDNGNLRKGKAPSTKSFLSFLPRLTGGYTILYFIGLHFLSLFFTPLIFLPGILLTLVFLVVYKRVPAVASAVAKIRI